MLVARLAEWDSVIAAIMRATGQRGLCNRTYRSDREDMAPVDGDAGV